MCHTHHAQSRCICTIREKGVLLHLRVISRARANTHTLATFPGPVVQVCRHIGTLALSRRTDKYLMCTLSVASGHAAQARHTKYDPLARQVLVRSSILLPTLRDRWALHSPKKNLFGTPKKKFRNGGYGGVLFVGVIFFYTGD